MIQPLSNFLYFVLNTIVTFGSNYKLWGKSNVEVSREFDTLVTPAGWAFGIWGVIFTLEFILALYIMLYANETMLKSIDFSNGVNYLNYAYIFQILWSFAFAQTKLLTSFILLLGIAICLFFSVKNLMNINSSINNVNFLIIPITIHFSWTTIAALVNGNLYVVSLSETYGKSIELLPALCTIWAALIFGLYRLILYYDITYNIVVVWALSAIYHKLSHSPPHGHEKYIIDHLKSTTKYFIFIILLFMLITPYFKFSKLVDYALTTNFIELSINLLLVVFGFSITQYMYIMTSY